MGKKEKEGASVMHIGRILPDVVRTCRPASDTAMTGVWDIWDEAVGESIAENTQPAAFKGNLLLVYVSSSVWLHQLQFVKQDLIDKVNKACGQRLVNEIRFKIGPLESGAGAE